MATVDENDAIVNETYVPYTNLAASYTGSSGENVTIPEAVRSQKAGTRYISAGSTRAESRGQVKEPS